MPDYTKPPVYFHETEFFKKWMSDKGYIWPKKLIEQESIIAEFCREELEAYREKNGES